MRTKEEIREYKKQWARKRRVSMTKEEKRKTLDIQKKSYNKHKDKRLELSRKWKKNHSNEHKSYRKKYYSENKQREREANKNWIGENRESYKELKKISDKSYRERNKNKLSEKQKANRSMINEQQRDRYKNNINYNMAMRLRASLTQAIRLSGAKKTVTIFKLIGIPVQDLIKHLESLFKKGMSWDNRNEWHIDHIRPCASFDLTDINQQKECFHYTNLQPLWNYENHVKSSFYEGKYHKYKNEDSIDL